GESVALVGNGTEVIAPGVSARLSQPRLPDSLGPPGPTGGRLDLSYCELRAPFDGQVGRRQLRVGAYVTPGSALLAVVPLQQAYVVGNFQETQLTHVSPGQAVEIRVDTFPGEVLRGHVDSIAPATGLSFAPIAPDNATGNFTKVVQRIPVKIVLEPRQAMAGKLRVGMSVEARIDTATGTRSAEVAQQ
ncbi:HlyD family secretion protein, partial [Pseudomonas aeruginosa]|uniref:HlyD family secretion protein n=1 Tax=Pseudomonas aeruginosa TaxID=287 RepID=UPI001D0CEB3E